MLLPANGAGQDAPRFQAFDNGLRCNGAGRALLCLKFHGKEQAVAPCVRNAWVVHAAHSGQQGCTCGLGVLAQVFLLQHVQHGGGCCRCNRGCGEGVEIAERSAEG